MNMPGLPAPGGAPPDDTLKINVGGYQISGWQETSVRRGLEEVPSSFDISLTEKYPAVPNEVVIAPGDPCTITIGKDTVLTGYVDRYTSELSGNQHVVRIQGRSKVEDLVDCSAVWADFQISGTDVADVASKLAKPYNVPVNLVGKPGKAIAQYNINVGDTPWAIIEVLARYSQKLVYDDQTGALVIADLGVGKHASGFQQGANVKAAEVVYSMDQRFSEYRAYMYSTASLSDPTGMGNNLGPPAVDQGVPRFRRLDIVDSESNEDGQQLGTFRATWEMQRRRGRSQSVRVVCTGWRDTAGRLWTPNVLAPVNIPACKVAGLVWLVSGVEYQRGRGGTTAVVTLMPPEAFTVEPSSLNLFDTQLARAVQEGLANKGGASP